MEGILFVTCNDYKRNGVASCVPVRVILPSLITRSRTHHLVFRYQDICGSYTQVYERDPTGIMISTERLNHNHVHPGRKESQAA